MGWHRISQSNQKSKMIGTRIAKLIAASGRCSRREAEALIEEGRVKVNGQVISSPATFITDQSVKVDDKLINAAQPVRLWLFHKPAGFLTTTKDPENRKTIFDLLPKNLPRVIAIGRLDYNTEGLLLLTTSGSLARHLELPKNKFLRQYRARVFGKIDRDRLKRLERGITVDGVRYGSIKVEVELEKPSNSWLRISLTEGKNREIRKVMEYLGLRVNRLIRVSFADFKLGSLGVGQTSEVRSAQVNSLLPKPLPR
ncbi:MAG: rRNA pseudouridine synthase [Alphaproteobacteria bacterium]|nr:rRNA pseudouridine synthase [Alphaproteobacteria bacterium]